MFSGFYRRRVRLIDLLLPCPVPPPTLHDHLKVVLCKCFFTPLYHENKIVLLTRLNR